MADDRPHSVGEQMAAESEFETTVSKYVIRSETNDGRFERFCNGVVSSLEGGAVVNSTSRSWDLGRDGVARGSAAGIYICTSLRDDPDAKALSDVERITSTTKGVKRLYFCSSQELSEYQISKIETALGREVDNAFSIVCLGAAQLVETAQQNDLPIFEQCYGAEIRNVTSAIQADDQSDPEKGLRLALLSASADDSRSI